MSNTKDPKSGLPVALAVTYLRLLPVARKCGYALALHGSMNRDLDLIAVPWTNDAIEPEELVDALKKESGAITTNQTIEGTPWPRMKPHGRMCYSLFLAGEPYIDLSVMPRDIYTNEYDRTGDD
jgi:hypothetical protein